jgi:3-hydroxybutyryl-CoA dehydrogenase
VPVLLVEVIRACKRRMRPLRRSSVRARPRQGACRGARLPGFVSNRILMPFINEAAYALMEGVAEAEAIDTIAKLGFAHPIPASLPT